MTEQINNIKTKTDWNINKYKIKEKTNINKIIEQAYFFYFLIGEPTLKYYLARRDGSPNNII